MGKVNWKPGTMIYPVPAALITVGSSEEDFNVLTIAWTGTVCSDPPMCYVSVRPGRHSYTALVKNMEFVVNITTEDLAEATDWCGVRSGREYNKFKEMGLTLGKADMVSAPIIEEAPINIECKVKDIISLGSHDMFLAEVVNVKADEAYLDSETGAFDLSKAKPICYSHGFYYKVGEKIGKFGWTVEKSKKKKSKS